MTPRSRALVLGVLAALVAGAGLGAPAGRAADPVGDLRARVLGALRGSTAAVTGVGVHLDGLGRVVESHGPQPLPPASTLKVYVGATAALRLGWEHRWRTEVGGAILPGGVVGQLHLRAGGDPTVTGDDLQRLAFAVHGAGVRRITGGIVVDVSRYDERRDAPGWKAGFLPAESAPLSALVVDGNRWRDDAAYVRDPVPANAARLAVALRRAGIEVAGSVTRGVAHEGVKPIASHVSPPLGAVVGHMLKASDNFEAEMILKELGAVLRGAGSTAHGLDVVRDQSAAFGMGPLAAAADGSGLSTRNRVAPLHEVDWLVNVARTPGADLLRLSLPLACGDGTLQRRFCGTPAAGRVHAKTGTVDGVVALAGYTATATGRRAVFSFQLDGVRSIAAARAAVDRAVVAIVTSGA